jgi:hypothetical protein
MERLHEPPDACEAGQASENIAATGPQSKDAPLQDRLIVSSWFRTSTARLWLCAVDFSYSRGALLVAVPTPAPGLAAR